MAPVALAMPAGFATAAALPANYTMTPSTTGITLDTAGATTTKKRPNPTQPQHQQQQQQPSNNIIAIWIQGA